MKLNKLSLLSAIAATAMAHTSHAATIYSEIFGTNNGIDSPSDAGWSVYNSGGTNLSNSTTVPMEALSTSMFFGSQTGEDEYAFTSDAATINLADYTDLTVSFSERASDDDNNDAATQGYRVLAVSGGQLYASNFISRATTLTTHDVIVANAVWNAWDSLTAIPTGGAFNIGNISGTSGNLGGASITSLGILGIDGTDGNPSNDRMRLRDFSVTGTAVIPEPSTVILSSLGLLALFRRRR
jgi:hypothetical protein